MLSQIRSQVNFGKRFTFEAKNGELLTDDQRYAVANALCSRMNELKIKPEIGEVFEDEASGKPVILNGDSLRFIKGAITVGAQKLP